MTEISVAISGQATEVAIMSRLGWTWDEVVAWHAATVARYMREVAAGPRASGRQYACYMEFAEMRAITCQGLPEVPFWRPAEAENKKAETKETGTQTADAKEEKKTAKKEKKTADAKEKKTAKNTKEKKRKEKKAADAKEEKTADAQEEKRRKLEKTADAKEEKTADAKEEKAVDAKEEKVQCPVSHEFLEKKWGTHRLLAPEDWHLWS